MSDLTARILAYEAGTLEEGETIALFQELVDTRLVFVLQGHYGRVARDLVDAGLVTIGGQS